MSLPPTPTAIVRNILQGISGLLDLSTAGEVQVEIPRVYLEGWQEQLQALLALLDPPCRPSACASGPSPSRGVGGRPENRRRSMPRAVDPASLRRALRWMETERALYGTPPALAEACARALDLAGPDGTAIPEALVELALAFFPAWDDPSQP
jgi:hypothetical protein